MTKRVKDSRLENEFASVIIARMDTSLINNALRTSWLGRDLHFKTEVNSTQSWAHDAGGKRGSVFLADFQTGGYGRLRREWESPAGKNVMMTFLDAPPADPSLVSQLTLVAGVACARALKECGTPVYLKWPNDLYVQKKKIGGILCESNGKTVRVGIGINVNSSAEEFTKELQPLLTSMSAETAREKSREAVIAAILNHYEVARERYDRLGVDTILEDWSGLTFPLGTAITIQQDGTVERALYKGLSPEGYLLADVSGKIVTVIAGDVRLV